LAPLPEEEASPVWTDTEGFFFKVIGVTSFHDNPVCARFVDSCDGHRVGMTASPEACVLFERSLRFGKEDSCRSPDGRCASLSAFFVQCARVEIFSTGQGSNNSVDDGEERGIRADARARVTPPRRESREIFAGARGVSQVHQEIID